MGSFTVTIADLQKLPEMEPIPMYDEFSLAKCNITCQPETCMETCGQLSCGHTVGGLPDDRRGETSAEQNTLRQNWPDASAVGRTKKQRPKTSK
jgi:hypothetical protein